jgi:NEDD8-activating enzyme E1 regulatory subunit
MFLSNPESLNPFTLILATAPINPELLSRISAHASAVQIPVFYIHSVGFLSSFSVQLPSAFPIVDTHPDPETISDLRLLTPWPALLEFTKSKTQGFDTLNDQDHGHVPWAVLLLYYLEDWKASHGGQAPQNYKEKTAFRDLVSRGARTNTAEGGEENFDEAVAAVLKSLNPAVPNSSVREIFEAPECQSLTATVWRLFFFIISHFHTLVHPF